MISFISDFQLRGINTAASLEAEMSPVMNSLAFEVQEVGQRLRREWEEDSSYVIIYV